jgi:hypothetical protein
MDVSPSSGSSLLHAAQALDGVFLAAVRYGTSSTAWQDAALHLLEVLPRDGTFSLHLGPGFVAELGLRAGALGTQTHAIHEAWRDGVRRLTWDGGCDPSVHRDGLRALCAAADACHAAALQEHDGNLVRAWGGSARAQDTVTRMLFSLGGRPGLTVGCIDPYADAFGPVRDASRLWVQLPRPETARVLVEVVSGGVEAPRRVEASPPSTAGTEWQTLARSIDVAATPRGLAILDAASRANDAADDVLLAAWEPLLDALFAEDDPARLWSRLGPVFACVLAIAPTRPLASGALRTRLTAPERAGRVVEALGAALASRDAIVVARDVATWISWSPPGVRSACSATLASRHDEAFAREVEAALVGMGGGDLVSLAELYGAHLLGAPVLVQWALQRLVEVEPDALSTMSALRGALRSSDEDVRWRALLELGDDDSEATLAAQDSALFSARPEVVAYALEAVVERGDDTARAALLRRVHASDLASLSPTARIRFLDGLARLGGDAAAAWMGGILAERGWFLSAEVKERQGEIRQVLTRLGTPWAQKVLSRGDKP